MSINRSVLARFALPAKNALLNHSCTAVGATIKISTSHRKISTKESVVQKPCWNSIILEAEKIASVGPSPFLNLHWLRRSEFAKVALHLEKYPRFNYHILKNVNLIYNENNEMQTYWGLVIFLMSKAAGHPNVDNQEKETTGILRSQMALAEVAEMIYISHLIHKGIVNMEEKDTLESSELKDFNDGNKITLLIGDYLLASSFSILAKIRNQEVSELLSSTVRNLTESEFMCRRADNQNNPLPTVPPLDRTGYALKEWTQINELSISAFLGKSCKATLKLAKHREEIQEQGFNFGKHLALAWQANRDLYPFIGKDRGNSFSLCSAPVMFHIERDPSILTEIDKGLESVSNVDYAKVYDIIISGPGIELTKQLQQEHSQRAMEALNVFQESDARTVLSNIVAVSANFL